MKGPGLRIDIDVRRVWRCPVCGQSQRQTADITAPRCHCVRDGVPMTLVEDQRPGRLALRPEPRSMLDRIQAGEEFPRMTSLVSDDCESGSRDSGGFGGSRPRNRPPRPERSGASSDRPPREPRLGETQNLAVSGSVPKPASSQAPAVPSNPPPVSQEADDFGAGLGTDAPQSLSNSLEA